MLRIRRARTRFRAIARADGVGVAVFRAARKLVKKLGAPVVSLCSCLVAWVTHRYTPPPRLDPYDGWLRVNRDNPRRRRRIEAALGPARSTPRFSILVPAYNPPVDVFGR